MGLAEGYNAVATDQNRREELRQQAAVQNAQLSKMGYNADGTPATSGIGGQQQDVMQKQLALVQQQLKAQQNLITAKDSALQFSNSIETGDFTTAQKYLDSNPDAAALWKSQGVSRVDNINFDKDSSMLASIGFTPEQYTDPAVKAKISKMFFKVQDDTGNWSVRSAEDVMKQTNMRTNLASSQWDNINSSFRDAKTAMTPQKDDKPIVGDLGKFTADYRNLYPDADSKTVENAYTQYLATKKESKGTEPFSIQTAKHFGDLVVKESNGTLTQAERAELDQHRTEIAGTGYKTNIAMKSDNSDFEKKYNVDLKTVDVNSLPPQAQEEVSRITRNLEDTPSGKEVTKLVAKDIEGGIGAVMTNAVKLSKLASSEHVQTSAVRNMIESVKEYLPESWRSVDDKDLANSEFRKVYLSTASAMLKIQSGLTVSDAERNNFEQSMGTLNKNTKTNMAGVKVKFDEIRSNFQAIKALNPELYNLKYSAADKQLNSISGMLDGNVQPSKGERNSSTSGSATPGHYTPKDLIPPPQLVLPDSSRPAGQSSGHSVNLGNGAVAPGSTGRPPLDSFRLK